MFILSLIGLSPSAFIAEFASGQELSGVGTFDSSCCSRFLVGIRVQIVVVNMLWNEFTRSSVRLRVSSTIWKIIPSGLGLVSEQDMATIVPFKPSPHLLRKRPDMFIVWAFMQPMVQWSLKICSMGVDMTWEFSLKSWNNVVECQSVSR